MVTTHHLKQSTLANSTDHSIENLFISPYTTYYINGNLGLTVYAPTWN